MRAAAASSEAAADGETLRAADEGGGPDVERQALHLAGTGGDADEEDDEAARLGDAVEGPQDLGRAGGEGGVEPRAHDGEPAERIAGLGAADHGGGVTAEPEGHAGAPDGGVAGGD